MSTKKAPWLLQLERAQDDSSRHIFKIEALQHSGEVAHYCDEHDDVAKLETCLGANMGAGWYNALAAEALLVPLDRRRLPPFDKLPLDAKPCGVQGPTYGELSGCSAAVALFPMAGEAAQLGRIWAIKGGAVGEESESLVKLEGVQELMEHLAKSGIRLVPELPDGFKVWGRSWQLAASLAIKALESKNALVPILLARKYIATGSVDGDEIGAVTIGNKLGIVRSSDVKRTWLLPEGNQDVFEVRERANKVEVPKHTVRKVDLAWSIINSYGTRPADEERWPSQVKVMHILVGGSTASALTPLLYATPEEIHLWHSDSKEYSVKQTDEIEAEIRACLSKHVRRVYRHELPSNSLVRAEDELDKGIDYSDDGEPSYVNITSGNRMMMLAADRWAVNKKNVKLIYRDLDDKKRLGYVCIWHDGTDSYTCMLMPEVDGAARGALLELLNMGGSGDRVRAKFRDAVAALKMV